MCLTTGILAPGASEVGLGAAAPAALCAHWRHWRHWRLNSARSLFVRKLATKRLLESHLLGIGRPFWRPSHPKLYLGAQGTPNGPTASQGSQREAKATPRRAPWEPKAPQRLPKGSPKSPQGEQNELQRHPKETNKSQNYIHINKIQANSRSTAIQRPTSSSYYLFPIGYSVGPWPCPC